MLKQFRDLDIRVTDLEITRPSSEIADRKYNAHSIFMLQLNRKSNCSEMINQVASIPGVVLAEEL